ncbi:hypothetical protein AYO41_02010 [Verrucomicrobia bacterium SCGC AG-212-E04]|nr:hypothetical protein AYO41_02010 [Verrucomicrobia bacterium SCGC AG-212-E04]
MREGPAKLKKHPAKDEERPVEADHIPAAHRPQDEERRRRDGHEHDLLRGRPQIAQLHRAHEAAHEHATPEQRDVLAGLDFAEAGDGGLAEETYQRAADGDLAADVHEDGHDAEHHVRKAQRGDAGLDFPLAHVREVHEKENHREDQEDDAEREIGHLDRLRAVRAGASKILEDEVATDQRPDGCADRVEALREIQPARGGALGAENGDIRIRRDLQHGEAKTDDEKTRQE